MDQIEKFVKDSGLKIPAYNVWFYDSNGITRTTKVEIVPFEDVTADCAAAEGDGTLAAWKKAHRKAFAAACEEIGIDFDERMKCVCEYFDDVYRAVGQ